MDTDGKPSGYQVRQVLPEALRDSLPSVERIEAELSKVGGRSG